MIHLNKPANGFQGKRRRHVDGSRANGPRQKEKSEVAVFQEYIDWDTAIAGRRRSFAARTIPRERS